MMLQINCQRKYRLIKVTKMKHFVNLKCFVCKDKVLSFQYTLPHHLRQLKPLTRLYFNLAIGFTYHIGNLAKNCSHIFFPTKSSTIYN